MKNLLLLLITFCFVISIANSDGGFPTFGFPENKGMTKMFFPFLRTKKEEGPHGTKPDHTVRDVVAQIGPGLVTDMTVFKTCGGKPIQFSDQYIISGIGCKNETCYGCYKLCQFHKAGFINEKDESVDSEKLENYFSGEMMEKGQNKMEDLAECFKEKTFKQDEKCIEMKIAMQCVWDSYYKNCEPNSEYNKDKRLVTEDLWQEENEGNDQTSLIAFPEIEAA